MSRLRHRRPRRRPRRLRGRALRGVRRADGGAGREAEGGRHLPAPRLHPGQGAAARRRGVPDGRPCRRARRQAAPMVRARRRTGRGVTSARAASSTTLHKGLSGLLKRRKVTVVDGFGTLTAGRRGLGGRPDAHRQGRDHLRRFGAARRCRAWTSTASASSPPTTRPTATPRSFPERVAVIGGGVIGAEFASVYTDLGCPDTRCWRRCRTACCRSARTATSPTCWPRRSPSAARTSTPRPGSAPSKHTSNGVLVPFETPKGSEKIEVDQVLVVDRAPPGQRGHGRWTRPGSTVSDRGFIEVDTARC